ncbi:serine hydrolase domain-containing protein [Stenotrophomonas nematodicola]|uniref:serine hydrolase domain-containing protein n=1 Tax=Stenotrophomonas nematodicola TaxID=2656746 RepID=UPI003D9A798F
MVKACCAALMLACLTGCTSSDEGTRASCVEKALDQPGLEKGVAVFTTEHGGVAQAKAGWLNLRSADSVLPMASLTKPLVAGEVRRRVDRGELGLEQPVGELLPGVAFVPETASITVRQLLQHRAGFDRSFRDPLFASTPPSCQAAARDVLQRQPELGVGQQMLYSNAGYCVLGEILLSAPSGLTADLRLSLDSPLGAAGGWSGTLHQLYGALYRTLPLVDIPTDVALPDGSYYTYGWRRWPAAVEGPSWSHFGRLPGMVSLALSDGRGRLLVAHFLGDPQDVDASSLEASRALWRCMEA